MAPVTHSRAPIPVDAIDIPDTQKLRLDRDDPALDDLARSLMRHGLLNPITLRTRGERYELLAGSRRLRAARLNNWTEIDANIVTASDDQALAITLTENIQRLDLTPIEQAVALQTMIETDDPPMDELRRRVGKSEAWINDRLSLLRWPQSLQQAVHHGKLSLAVAAILTRVPDPDARETLTLMAIQNGISAQTATLWVQQHNAQAVPEHASTAPESVRSLTPPTYETRPICQCCEIASEPSMMSTLHVCSSCCATMAAAREAHRNN